ncbi:hypothetical protein PSHT_15246 [Puccinia striiformis]|uniref:Secreted protein n=1 Tax=Puccinia striiformis TaxID=27350 RepID=A0A2S4UGD4_9BASI|nr:hypothetical protein PSHT_15246 [Puccinia striiformis]
MSNSIKFTLLHVVLLVLTISVVTVRSGCAKGYDVVACDVGGQYRAPVGENQNCIIGLKKCCNRDMVSLGTPSSQHLHTEQSWSEDLTSFHYLWLFVTPGQPPNTRRQMCVSHLAQLANGDPNTPDLGSLNHLREPYGIGTKVHERTFEAVVQQVRSGLWKSLDSSTYLRKQLSKVH